MTKPHNPIRCFQGNAQPYEPFWKFVNAADSQSGQAEMELYGVISEYSWFEDEISPKKFKDDLYKYGKGGPLMVKVDSPGGDVIAASTMRTIMMDYPGEITMRVDGMAASAAVIVTIAGKTVKIMDSAYMMIHDPAVVVLLAYLDIETLGSLRDTLKSIKDGIVPPYAAKTGLSEERISAMMSRETWMSAREAVDYGFADEIITGGQKKAAATMTNLAFVNALQNYVNVPPDLLKLTEAPAPLETQPSAADVERAQKIKSLREFIDSKRK